MEDSWGCSRFWKGGGLTCASFLSHCYGQFMKPAKSGYFNEHGPTCIVVSSSDKILWRAGTDINIVSKVLTWHCSRTPATWLSSNNSQPEGNGLCLKVYEAENHRQSMVGGRRLQLFVVGRGHSSGQLAEGGVLIEAAGHIFCILSSLAPVQQKAKDRGQLGVLSWGGQDSDLHGHRL